MQMLLQNELMIATNNPGKLIEFTELLGQGNFKLTSPAEKGISLEVLETGNSYLENAILKARAFSKVSNMIVIADDSGLEVDALDGEPGLYSARFGGVKGKEQQQYLLSQMKQSGNAIRTARFRCVVVLYQPNSTYHSFEGVCEGEIGMEAKGTKGFGYDPLFFLPEYNLTMAELDPEIKNKISHRAKAIQISTPKINELFPKNIDS